VACLDVTGALRSGTNRLRIEAQNASGACGLLAVLNLVYRDGRKERIVSDRSWIVINSAGKTGKAVEIAPFGKGPWSYRLVIVNGKD